MLQTLAACCQLPLRICSARAMPLYDDLPGTSTNVLQTRTSNWRRNLVAVWLALFAAGFGINLSLPFLPLFMSRELNLSAPGPLAFWSGVVLASGNLSALVCQPIWGLVGDRFGRRPMLIRSMTGVSLTLLLTSLVPSVPALVGSRFLMGVVGGNTSSAQAIVVDGSPRHQIGWALGMAGSARPIGPYCRRLLVSASPPASHLSGQRSTRWRHTG